MKPVMLGGIALGITVIAAVGAWSTNQAIAWWVAVPDAEMSPAPKEPEQPDASREFAVNDAKSH